MGGACSVDGRDEKWKQYLENLKGRDHSENIVAD
jgi:hypothetical protein